MLYPRKTEDGNLVSEDQMVSYREHLTQKHRVLFFSGRIGERCPACGTGETDSHNLLLALDSLSHDPIKLIITSPGGDLDAAFLFYDTIRLIKSPVETLGRYCASAAAMLLAAGSTRYLMPHAKVMLHLPAGQYGGDTRDIDIWHAEITKYKDKMVDILIECGAKKSPRELLTDMDRDFWLEPKEAISYGLADKVMEREDLERWLK